QPIVSARPARIACLARQMRFNPLPKRVAYFLSIHPCRPPNSQQLESQSCANGNPECKRNLLLRRRLDEKSAPLRIIRIARGQIRLETDGPLTFVERR
ncbi:hypothetical protein, partial [Sphingopyxis granuli]|uniref:hypothetical protein n=1 Tax=Sphingopyxis granuli TaxID=267128 RepID=UPI003B026A8C